MPLDLPPSSYTATIPSFTMITPGAQNLIISCGKGTVNINLETGKVTLIDCALDDGAKAWWKAVEQFAPMKKK